MRADLHVHSTASDGTLHARDLVKLAEKTGITHLSITDHDSVASWTDARAIAAQARITLITGVELSAHSADGRDVHVLGYFIDPGHSGLLAALAALRAHRLERAERIVGSLVSAGFSLSLDDVLEHSGTGAVGRSHVARALVAAGDVPSVSDAFTRLLGRGSPHYVAKRAFQVTDALELVHAAGGLAVVAHPGVGRLDDLVPALAKAGLDGLEAYHSDHSPAQWAHYAELARAHGLLVTGGSDFHGPTCPTAALGSVPVPPDAVAELITAGSPPA